MNICIAGKNDIAVEILLYILDEKIKKDNIYIIPNETDNGKNGWQRSLLKKAKELKIKIVTLEEVYNINNLLFLSLEFDKIINPRRFKTDWLFNIHFSLLPKYRGMFTSIMPILNNEKFTGVTFHKIDKSIDTGLIIEQCKFRIETMDNSRDLYHKYIENAIIVVKNNINKLLNGENLDGFSQNFLESSYFSKNAIDFSNIKIDLNQTVINIHNQIRAFNFREYQVPKVFNHRIISSKILNSSSNKKPGEIIFENDICYVLSSIDKDIVIYKDRVQDLFLACENGSFELVNRLVQIPKIINTQNINGWTPLIVAIFNNNKDIVKTLLTSGADINISSFKGTTTLMYAKSAYLQHHDDEIIKLLLDLDIDVFKTDYANKNVLDYCIENNEKEVLKIIEKNIKGIYK